MVGSACVEARFSPIAGDTPVSATVTEEPTGDLPSSEDAVATAGSNSTAGSDAMGTPPGGFSGDDIVDTAGSSVDDDSILETASSTSPSDEIDQRSTEKGSGTSSDSSTIPPQEKGKGKDKKSGSGASGACSKALGIPAEKIKIAGSGKVVELTSSDALAVKLTGNKNTFKLKLESPGEGAKISGICIFIAGNLGQIKVESNASIGQIYVKQRGNQPRVSFKMGEGVSVDSIQTDLNGNKPSLTIEGAGSFDCSKVSGAGISCKP